MDLTRKIKTLILSLILINPFCSKKFLIYIKSKMSNIDIWLKYIKIERIGLNNYSVIYKAKDKKNGNYVAIKEIDKERFFQLTKLKLNENKIIKLKNENSIKIKEFIENKKYYYLIMDFCICNLDDCIKSREKGFSIKEVREVLIQLNNSFKLMKENKLIHRKLNPKNILISLDKVDKCLFKLSNNYDATQSIEQSYSVTYNFEDKMTMAPEYLIGENISEKSNIWSLGIIIYYMLFKEYPFFAKNENELYNNILSGKKLNSINEKYLDDLLKKMLIINVNQRISWDEYFKHSFFNKTNDNSNFPLFELLCKKHSNIYCYYCKNCKTNFCEYCIKEHFTHTIIPFSKIGLNKGEINQMNNLIKEIDLNMHKFNKIIVDIKILLNQMKIINDNTDLFNEDNINNYKKYYIDYLSTINEIIKPVEDFILIDLYQNNIIYYNLDNNKNQENYLICEYNINQNDLENPNYIIKSYEEIKRKENYWTIGNNNEKEIIDNTEIYVNDEKIDFCFEYKFPKIGKYTIKFMFKKPLTNINWIFYNCKSLISINFSNFNSNDIKKIACAFSYCSSLKDLNLSNFKTYNIEDISFLFEHCSSLETLDLSNFLTEKVTNMWGTFWNCGSLKNLNLSNFNTNKVVKMSQMFKGCYSLTSLDLNNFNTINVTEMNEMFQDCTKLTSIKLTSFDTHNVINMDCMFCNCSSLLSLDLSNFNIDKTINMRKMFNNCSSLTLLNLNNFIINNDKDTQDIFNGLNKNCNIIAQDKKLLSKFNN